MTGGCFFFLKTAVLAELTSNGVDDKERLFGVVVLSFLVGGLSTLSSSEDEEDDMLNADRLSVFVETMGRI